MLSFSLRLLPWFELPWSERLNDLQWLKYRLNQCRAGVCSRAGRTRYMQRLHHMRTHGHCSNRKSQIVMMDEYDSLHDRYPQRKLQTRKQKCTQKNLQRSIDKRITTKERNAQRIFSDYQKLRF